MHSNSIIFKHKIQSVYNRYTIEYLYLLCVSTTNTIFKGDIYFEVEKNSVFTTVFDFKVSL